MANVVYNKFKDQLIRNEIDLLADDIKVMLVLDYNPEVDLHEFVSDVNSYEISGVGYDYGGKSLTNKSLERDDVNDRVKFSADNVSWENSYLSADGIILYKNTGDYSSSSLIVYIEFDFIKESSNTSLRVEWSIHEGIFYI